MKEAVLDWIARMAMKPFDLLHDRYCPCQAEGHYEELIEIAAQRQAEAEAREAADPDPMELRIARGRGPWEQT